MFYLSLISLLFIHYCLNFETNKSTLHLIGIAIMTVKYNIEVHEQDKKCTLTDVTYIQFIGGIFVGDNCFGKTYSVLIINALGALHQDARSRFCVFYFSSRRFDKSGSSYSTQM